MGIYRSALGSLLLPQVPMKGLFAYLGIHINTRTSLGGLRLPGKHWTPSWFQRLLAFANSFFSWDWRPAWKLRPAAMTPLCPEGLPAAPGRVAPPFPVAMLSWLRLDWSHILCLTD